MLEPIESSIAARMLLRLANAGLFVEMRIERENAFERLTLLTCDGERNLQAVRIDSTDDEAFDAAAVQLARQCGVVR